MRWVGTTPDGLQLRLVDPITVGRRRKFTSLVAATVTLRPVPLQPHHHHRDHYGYSNRYVKPWEYRCSGLFMLQMQNGTSELATCFHISHIYNLIYACIVTFKPWTSYSKDDYS